MQLANGEEAKTPEQIVDKDPLDGEALGAISVGPGGPCPKGLADGEARNSNITWDRGLELSLLNVESLVSAVQQAALNTSLVFVHTTRRFYR